MISHKKTENFSGYQTRLATSLSDFNIATDAATQEKLLAYLANLAQWNTAFNLTALRQPEDMFVSLLLDSLTVYSFMTAADHIIDVGTGAGLPGIPLAILYPEKRFVLLDSNGKKTRFLTQVCHILQLNNVEVRQERVEKLNPSQKFDIVMSRAFSSTVNMIELTEHLGSESSLWLTLKGANVASEIAELPLGFKLEFQQQVTVPGLNRSRYVIGIRRGN